MTIVKYPRAVGWNGPLYLCLIFTDLYALRPDWRNQRKIFNEPCEVSAPLTVVGMDWLWVAECGVGVLPAQLHLHVYLMAPVSIEHI